MKDTYFAQFGWIRYKTGSEKMPQQASLGRGSVVRWAGGEITPIKKITGAGSQKIQC